MHNQNSYATDYTISPVVKWAGGKRQMISTLLSLMPKHFNKYYEPFFGGGALFCSIKPKYAVINDVNLQLMNMYRQIQNNFSNVCRAIDNFQCDYNQKASMDEKDYFYYEMREKFNTIIHSNVSNYISAALLIFLNKSGFNGLYRVNSSGKYNVPPAHKNTLKLYDYKNITELSRLLKQTTIMCGDFANSCKDAVEGDFIFFDSPYYDTFDTYQAGGFSKKDHIRLYELFNILSKKGVHCMLTNNNCEFIKHLYSKYNIMPVNVKRMISCNGKNRVGKEVIITNY